MSELDQRIPMIPPTRARVTVSILAETEDFNHRIMNVPAMWKRTMGQGIKVAVLDTGLPKHVDILPAGGKSFISGYLEDKNGHGCVDPDTLVHTTNGGIEPIRDLYNAVELPETLWVHPDGARTPVKDVRGLGIRTYALDADGTVITADVTHLHKTPVQGEIVNVTLEGCITYRLTPWHPVVVKRRGVLEKVRADALVPGDRMMYADGTADIGTPQYIQGRRVRKCSACGHTPTYVKPRTVRCQCKMCGKSKWVDAQATYLLTEPLAYLLGLIATDGHVVLSSGHQYRVEVSNTTPELLRACADAAAALGFGRGVIQADSTRCGRWYCDSVELTHIVVNAGILTRNKTYAQAVPSVIACAPRPVVWAFLAGVIDGDGCVSCANVKNRITTVSSVWAYGLAALLNASGISAGVQTYQNRSFGGAVENTEVPVLNVTFASIPPQLAARLKHPRKRTRAQRCPAFTRRVRRIAAVSRAQYSGDFYDLTVTGAHTYIANGHFVSNTHCGGIIAAIANNNMGVKGIAPDVEDYYGAVLDADGSGSVDGIIKGIYWAADDVGADIISMSLGIAAGVSRIPALEKACNYAVSKGCAIFAAAGNEYGAVGQPAIFDSVFAVAAVNSKYEVADFSNKGKEVDYACGGVDVFSTFLNNTYAKLSGTSMATPACVGAAALVLADARASGKKLTPAELGLKLRKICFDIGPAGYDTGTGFGIPMFTNYASDYPAAEPVKPEPVPAEPPARHGGKFGIMGVPAPDCLYWRMFSRFIAEINGELDKGSHVDVAVAAGLRAVGHNVARINKAIGMADHS